MPSRRSLVLPLVAALAAFTLLAGACSSDDKADDKKTTTTEKSDKATGSEGDGSTTTVDPAEFEASVKKARQGLEDASGDPCKVLVTFQTLGTSIGTPTNAEQRKEATGLAIAFYRALADAAPSDLASEAKDLRAATDKIEQEGKDTNYSEEFLKSPKSIEGNDSFDKAATKIMTTVTTNCAGTSTTAAP